MNSTELKRYNTEKQKKKTGITKTTEGIRINLKIQNKDPSQVTKKNIK